MDSVKLLAFVGFVVIVMVLLPGCGYSQGWAVQFGVTPVTAVDNHSSLNTRESTYASKGDTQNGDKHER